MTLHQVMVELLARAVDPKYNIYRQDAYKIHASKLQKLIAVKGPTCLVCDVSVQDVDNIKLVDIYA
jgi:hypothetical protein